jgi:parvulin-like peptidyl-prolyl isomerase
VATTIGLLFLYTNNSDWQDTESNKRADQVAGIAARVNGKPITMAEIDRALKDQTEGKTSELSPLELQQARLQILNSLIERELLVQRAEKEDLVPSEGEITTAITDRKKESGMTDDEFQSRLKEQNMTMEKLRDEARKDLAVKKIQEKWAGKIVVSDQEVESYYNKDKAKFVIERGVRLAVIVVDPADNSAQGFMDDAKGDAAAKAKIDGIYEQLKQGASDFATVARAKSEDKESLLKGGDIGLFTEEGMNKTGFPNELTARFMGPMPVGSITEPLFINNKFYIFKLQERRLQTENLTLDSPGVRSEIVKELVKQKTEISNAQLLTTARNEAKIVNYLAATNP